MEAIAMATNGGQRNHSALDAALDIFRIRQYFNVLARARDLSAAIRKDARFLDTARRGILPLPSDRRPAPVQVFGPLSGAALHGLDGRSAATVRKNRTCSRRSWRSPGARGCGN
jgi:hypothetical protein